MNNDQNNNRQYPPEENPYQSRDSRPSDNRSSQQENPYQYHSPYQPYGNSYYPPHSNYPYRQPTYNSPGKGVGIAGFILSLLGLLCCGCVPPLSFGGLIFSIIAMVKGSRNGLSITGLVLGILGVLLSLFLLISFLVSGETFQQMYNVMPVL